MLQVFKNNETYAIGKHDTSVILLAWKKNVVKEGLDDLGIIQKLLYALNNQKKLFICTFVFKNVPIPDEEALRAMSTLLKSEVNYYHASVVVHFETGMRAMLAKTITWAIAKAANYPVPHIPFFSYRRAVDWMKEEFPDEVDTEALTQDIEKFLSIIMSEET